MTTSSPTKTPIKPADQFQGDSGRMSRDLRHRSLVQTAMGKYEAVRRGTQGRFQNWQSARQAASETKWETINHLDQYLEEFTRNTEARGTQICWAATGADACAYILDVCRRVGAKQVIKSKTMTSEEIHLNPALMDAGYGVVESDLGEYIVQLRGETPYHLVFPAMHLTRNEISDTFTEQLGTLPSDSPEALTMIARDKLRTQYLGADVGISGANFAIAETGMISITENEGNARLTTSVPRVHIALLGIEKVLPRLSDLALFLPMLATAGTGQALTCYNSLIGGPRQSDEVDGPEEFHVILLDNGRTDLLADPEQRDALHCIRCGACLNVCPVFRSVGGHSYGTTYQGPIGSVITPHLRGLQEWKHLSAASTLCGACTETCPVGIDLHHHLLQNRRNAVQAEGNSPERLAYRGFTFLMTHPRLYRWATRLAPLLQRLHRLVKGKKSDPLFAWTQSREFPAVQSQTFKDYWAERQEKNSDGKHR
jgi:L-lactate dehydrogenase complex protein LldF